MQSRLSLTDVPPEYRILANEFATWYVNSKPGDRYIYYYGESLHDDFSTEFLRKYVWQHACEGRVYIFQSRDQVDKRNFNFIAIKPKFKNKRMVPELEAHIKSRYSVTTR